MKATDKPNIVTLVWVCLGLAACVAPRHLMPVLPDLVGSWRLIHFVVDGQIQPAPGDEYTVKITPDHTYLSRPLDRVRRIRYIEWSDGCNTNWVAFRATGKCQV